MGKSMLPSTARLYQIERRQRVRKWSRFYEAAIRATRQEAPPHSRPSQINAPKFGRWLHALSQPEAAVFHLILYAPTVVEALDQHALPTTPAPHFLDEAPFSATTISHPAYRGTVIVAEELGVLRHHPLVKDVDRWLPFPFVGDLLVFHQNGEAIEAVNLTVKLNHEDFERPFNAGRHGKNREKEQEKVRARHDIEEKLHSDVGIKTVRVAGADIPPVLTRNLAWLHRTRTIPAEISNSDERRVIDALLESISREEPPVSAFRSVHRKWEISHQKATIVFADAVFKRELRIELIEELLLLDHPLSSERSDALSIVDRWLI